jgi:para-nitrobenzyl esterase
VKAGDIQALRALPYQTLIAAVNAVTARQSGGMPGMGPPRGPDFSPILDGIAITRDPFAPDAPAASADVPLLIGYVKDEMSIFMASAPWFGTMTEDQLKQFAGFTGPKGSKLVEAWRKIRPDYSPSYLFVAAISSQFFGGNSIGHLARSIARTTGRAVARSGRPASDTRNSQASGPQPACASKSRVCCKPLPDAERSRLTDSRVR